MKKVIVISIVFGFALFAMAVLTHATGLTSESSDKAVEIAKRSRDRIERNGKSLQMSSKAMFQAFAEKTVVLQNLIDARRNLEKAGLLTKGDPDGDARRAHINGKILLEVGELKKIIDTNLDGFLRSLDSFDDAVMTSLADTQATRSINSNYELALTTYMNQEKERFMDASDEAQTSLEAFQNEDDPKLKERLQQKYYRAKKRLLRIEMRRKQYEARVKVASRNQQISDIIRTKIRANGGDVSTKFKDYFLNIYNTFSKVSVITESGVPGTTELLSNFGFSSLDELNNTLAIASSSVAKLDAVFDDMINEVLSGLDNIEGIQDSAVSGQAFSVNDEMAFIQKQRESWNN